MPSQGQPKGAGQAAGDRSVTFTRGAAQRIAKAVRIVEGGSREQGGLTFDHPMPGVGGKLFRICTYTGSWSIGSTKTVTFKNQTATPNTAVATNLFFPISPGPTALTDCAIAKEGTAWYLVDVVLRTASANVVSDVSLSASLNTNDCTITIGKTLTTSNITFIQFKN